MSSRSIRVALNFLQDEDTKLKPGQVVSIPPYRGDMLEYIKQKEEEEGIYPKEAKFLRDLLLSKNGYKGKFLIHEHDASHLHWDLRLEFPVDSLSNTLKKYDSKRDGSPEPKSQGKDTSGNVLRSWAIPKHKIPKDSDKLLAVETEPHPMSYFSFEGTIPEGNYGAGEVEIFDKGTFEILDGTFDHSYKIRFKGEKLKGMYNLVKMGDTKNFLWFKSKE